MAAAAMQDFLEASQSEIPAMLKSSSAAATDNSNTAAAAASTAAAAALPSFAVLADGQLAGSWKVIPGMGHDSCLMCTLMGQLANEPGAAGPVSQLFVQLLLSLFQVLLVRPVGRLWHMWHVTAA
jgi:hypothetical protein